MNGYLKRFLHRGLLFGGFGPLIVALVWFFVSWNTGELSLSGGDILLGIVSSYLLAFLHAGVSVFQQIEHWSTGKSLFFHLLTLYVAYSMCYLLNSWIPFEWIALLIFTAVFLLIYFVVWMVVMITISITQKRLNRSLRQK